MDSSCELGSSYHNLPHTAPADIPSCYMLDDEYGMCYVQLSSSSLVVVELDKYEDGSPRRKSHPIDTVPPLLVNFVISEWKRWQRTGNIPAHAPTPHSPTLQQATKPSPSVFSPPPPTFSRTPHRSSPAEYSSRTDNTKSAKRRSADKKSRHKSKAKEATLKPPLVSQSSRWRILQAQLKNVHSTSNSPISDPAQILHEKVYDEITRTPPKNWRAMIALRTNR